MGPSNGSVTVVDYGAGNIFSVLRGLKASDIDVHMADTAEAIASADRILLPGVGAVGRAMEKLSAMGADEAIKDFVASGKPLLGICLGAQLLMNRSMEFGSTDCLGFIDGCVQEIPDDVDESIPNTGWSRIRFPKILPESDPLYRLSNDQPMMYFAHSYYCALTSEQDLVSDIQFGYMEIPAIIRKDNVVGFQFHPEISDKSGLTALAEFCKS